MATQATLYIQLMVTIQILPFVLFFFTTVLWYSNVDPRGPVVGVIL